MAILREFAVVFKGRQQRDSGGNVAHWPLTAPNSFGANPVLERRVTIARRMISVNSHKVLLKDARVSLGLWVWVQLSEAIPTSIMQQNSNGFVLLKQTNSKFQVPLEIPRARLGFEAAEIVSSLLASQATCRTGQGGLPFVESNVRQKSSVGVPLRSCLCCIERSVGLDDSSYPPKLIPGHHSRRDPDAYKLPAVVAESDRRIGKAKIQEFGQDTRYLTIHISYAATLRCFPNQTAGQRVVEDKEVYLWKRLEGKETHTLGHKKRLSVEKEDYKERKAGGGERALYLQTSGQRNSLRSKS
ncbi:hypothetical protein GE21DRAFT_8540 [Neurospora crassa]|uniref:Uncharacterized protein n=1 Tax=Neurospora crassa (strain ATCC 24698 / 74-OR23-1A / CBS 708.71 / DSM 1257 / FGSC 987) TaxID=367110 RepID=Q7RZ25_NEUCR|nr:hypothetical protein NCU07148 [Neurospora crassa OR74A]EAA28137.1 hypothetical protein NCU07148 [Neurospora crassa OR74A]KHE85828.1 hypothetical protein GE21DRAFT_8540 [Neurospora crassa]|eukprot:XP_957373.1 hypothetical protein NCU07148 [Neurospora crassa OR74A]